MPPTLEVGLPTSVEHKQENRKSPWGCPSLVPWLFPDPEKLTSEINYHREEEGKAWNSRERGTRREEGRVKGRREEEEGEQSLVKPGISG